MIPVRLPLLFNLLLVELHSLHLIRVDRVFDCLELYAFQFRVRRDIRERHVSVEGTCLLTIIFLLLQVLINFLLLLHFVLVIVNFLV